MFYVDVQRVLQGTSIMHRDRPPLLARGGAVRLSWLPVQLAGPPLPNHYIMSLSLCVYLSLSLSPPPTLSSSLLLIHSQENPLHICLSVSLSTSPPVCPSIFLSVCLSVCFYLFSISDRLSLHLSVCLSVCVCVSLSVCLSV